MKDGAPAWLVLLALLVFVVGMCILATTIVLALVHHFGGIAR